jgi:predicted RNA-binding protein YlqC (UPF0109 family)
MEELLAYLAKGLATRPEAVRIEREERDGALLLRVHVAPEDVGKLIGRQGRTVRALRTLARASGAKTGARTLVEIVG